ncbi:unnamed protein product, partial [Ectocarpus sp. 12 AP-2014]
HLVILLIGQVSGNRPVRPGGRGAPLSRPRSRRPHRCHILVRAVQAKVNARLRVVDFLALPATAPGGTGGGTDSTRRGHGRHAVGKRRALAGGGQPVAVGGGSGRLGGCGVAALNHLRRRVLILSVLFLFDCTRPFGRFLARLR